MYRRKSFHAPSRFYYLPANLGIPLIGDHHSILCLHFHRAIFSPLPVSQVLFLIRTLLLDLMPFFVVQGDLFIKFVKASFPKKIWFGGLEHEHIICGGQDWTHYRGECEVFYLWGSHSSSIQRDYTHFSGEWRDVAICFQWQHPEKRAIFSQSALTFAEAHNCGCA